VIIAAKFRLSAELHRAVHIRAREIGVTGSALAERLLHEGLTRSSWSDPNGPVSSVPRPVRPFPRGNREKSG
jgi:hypothetical protein